ncbi:MAG: hypothetical protein R6V15_01090, partial [Desulfotignum sp.]
AEYLQKKLFEYYVVTMMAGGRRTAAVVAAQYFRRLDGITTVYVSSSESRNLLRIDEKGVSKAVLVRLPEDRIKYLSELGGISRNSFTKNYVVARQRRSFVCILQVYYDYTSHALPSEGGRLRELKPDANWLTVTEEQILPKPSVLHRAPIPYKMIYTSEG